MLRRSFTNLNSVTTLLCTNCRLYDAKTGLCKINGFHAFENRSNESVCGTNGKKYLALDKRNLIKSEDYSKYSVGFNAFAIASVPFALVFDFRVFWSSYISWVLGWSFELLSLERKKTYLEENNIRD